MADYNVAAFDNYNVKGLEPCSGCGRTFNADALVRHQKMCLKNKGIGPIAAKADKNDP